MKHTAHYRLIPMGATRYPWNLTVAKNRLRKTRGCYKFLF